MTKKAQIFLVSLLIGLVGATALAEGSRPSFSACMDQANGLVPFSPFFYLNEQGQISALNSNSFSHLAIDDREGPQQTLRLAGEMDGDYEQVQVSYSARGVPARLEIENRFLGSTVRGGISFGYDAQGKCQVVNALMQIGNGARGILFERSTCERIRQFAQGIGQRRFDQCADMIGQISNVLSQRQAAEDQLPLVVKSWSGERLTTTRLDPDSFIGAMDFVSICRAYYSGDFLQAASTLGGPEQRGPELRREIRNLQRELTQ